MECVEKSNVDQVGLLAQWQVRVVVIGFAMGGQARCEASWVR